MERKIGNNRTHVPAERTGVQCAVEAISTGGISLLSETVVASDEELQTIEDKSFKVFESELVQSYIDNLQGQGVKGARHAAMLRGSFNGLIDKLNFLDATKEG